MNILFTEEQLKVVRKISYYEFCIFYNKECSITAAQYKELNLVYQTYNFTDFEHKEIFRQVNNIARRKTRLRSRIEFMLENYDCAFVTFTLNDNHINDDCHVLRTRICELLRELKCYFIGNIDFGSNTERLHFHFIISRDDCKKFLKLRYASEQGLNYGFIDFRKITRKNEHCLASYIDKLNNHALKLSTMKLQKANIITSRGDYSFTKILQKNA